MSTTPSFRIGDSEYSPKTGKKGGFDVQAESRAIFSISPVYDRPVRTSDAKSWPIKGPNSKSERSIVDENWTRLVVINKHAAMNHIRLFCGIHFVHLQQSWITQLIKVHGFVVPVRIGEIFAVAWNGIPLPDSRSRAASIAQAIVACKSTIILKTSADTATVRVAHPSTMMRRQDGLRESANHIKAKNPQMAATIRAVAGRIYRVLVPSLRASGATWEMLIPLHVVSVPPPRGSNCTVERRSLLPW